MKKYIPRQIQMLGAENGECEKNQARWYVKRLDTGSITYFIDFESAKIEALYLYDHGVCASMRPVE